MGMIDAAISGMGANTTMSVAAILNAAWQVRHYAKQRGASQRLRHEQAVRRLGAEVRRAFDQAPPEEHGQLLRAIVTGLCPSEDDPL